MGPVDTARGLEIARSIFREASDAFFVFDPEDGRVIDVNPAGLRMSGFERREVLAFRIQDLFMAEDDELERLIEALRETQYFHSREGYALARKTGDPIAINVSVSRIHTRPTSLGLVVARDVTELRRTEALRSAKEAAETASEAKNRLLANVSHELRTPLSAMLGLLDVLLEQAPVNRDSTLTADLRTIRRNGTHLARLIDDLLDLSRAEAGRLDVLRAPCRPAEVVADVLELLQPTAARKGLVLTADSAGTVPDLVWTDALRLQQILVNLVGNAIKYTDRGRVVMRVEPAAPGPNGPLLRFDISDTGTGLSAEALAGLFEPFHRGGTGSYGAGLGLAISRKLAELLGGTIEVRTEPGRGSTFSLRIETAPAEGKGAPPAPVPATPEPAASSSLPRLPCRVLLAEDHADNRRAISMRLSLVGLDVTSVSDGHQATTAALAQAARNQPFDVILMDMHMPVTDGFEATAQLRAAGYRGPIIALTADARSEDRSECLRCGCDEHLSKPVNWDHLLSLIATLAAGAGPEESHEPQDRGEER